MAKVDEAEMELLGNLFSFYQKKFGTKSIKELESKFGTAARELVETGDVSETTLNFGATAAFGATTVGTQSNPLGTDFYVGVFNSSEYFNGYMGEIIVYNAAIPLLQLQQTEAYLSQKWNI